MGWAASGILATRDPCNESSSRFVQADLGDVSQVMGLLFGVEAIIHVIATSCPASRPRSSNSLVRIEFCTPGPNSCGGQRPRRGEVLRGPHTSDSEGEKKTRTACATRLPFWYNKSFTTTYRELGQVCGRFVLSAAGGLLPSHGFRGSCGDLYSVTHVQATSADHGPPGGGPWGLGAPFGPSRSSLVLCWMPG